MQTLSLVTIPKLYLIISIVPSYVRLIILPSNLLVFYNGTWHAKTCQVCNGLLVLLTRESEEIEEGGIVTKKDMAQLEKKRKREEEKAKNK